MILEFALVGLISISGECIQDVDIIRERFYRKEYEEALGIISGDDCGEVNLDTIDLKSSILLFSLRREKREKGEVSRGLAEAFVDATNRGLSLATEMLQKNNKDSKARYLRGKLSLNLIWFDLEIVEKRRGLKLFLRTRRELKELAKEEPWNIRARISVAVTEFIIGERNPVERFFLGGGSREDALAELKVLAGCKYCSKSEKIEALYALADMLRRYKKLEEAAVYQLQGEALLPSLIVAEKQ